MASSFEECHLMLSGIRAFPSKRNEAVISANANA